MGLGVAPQLSGGSSLAWLNGDTLLATGGGCLVEIGVGPHLNLSIFSLTGSPGVVNAGNAHLGQAVE